MNQRVIIARLIFPITLLTVYIYISQQLFRFAALNKLELLIYHLITLIPFIALASMPYFFWNAKSKSEIERNEKFLPFVYFVLSYFSSLLFLILIRDISQFFSSLFDRQLFNYDLLEAQKILILPLFFHFIGYLTYFVGPFVKKVNLQHPHTPDLIKGIKIVQLSDIHIGPQMNAHSLKKIIQKVNKLNADFVVLTGDIIDAHPELHRDAIGLLNQIESKFDTLFIPGNHEYYHQFSFIHNAISQLKLTSLINETKIFELNGQRLSFSGAADPAAKMFNLPGPDLQKLSLEAEHADFRILLIHQPSAGVKIENSNFHLQLSGHTHAGQFVPWSLMIKLFQKYAKGLYKENLHWIYVNQGTGFWGPRNRFGTYCEITEIIL